MKKIDNDPFRSWDILRPPIGDYTLQPLDSNEIVDRCDLDYDYDTILEGVPIEEIERFLRKKKLEKINTGTNL